MPVAGSPLRCRAHGGATTMNATNRTGRLPALRRPQPARSAGEVSRRGQPARSARELHRLDLEELLEAKRAELAAVARLLIAPEGRRQFVGPAVDLDLAGTHLAGEGLGALDIGRLHAAGEAVDGGVGDVDGFLF